ncbi:adenylosuccinate synthetase [Fusarium acutatum]|uniref:Adenylosuccinate synthetase n=1 Tax=Fusarium acutatum TaxID=78861 RepID=A0A8H4JSD3_9HYPO|nr:adenylosuccinate synthetase [Fusarium acutatum]
MLDVIYSPYPFIDSSNTTLGSIISGLTLDSMSITETIGVVKACTGRIGQGVFKTENTENIGTKLREIGREWGTPTGRRRRCGWLDPLDVLDTIDTIKVAIAYKVDSTELEHYPADLDMLAQVEVVYHELLGWQKPATRANTFYDQMDRHGPGYETTIKDT